MLVGSAENCTMVGAAGAGFGASTTGGGGGGGGGGAFFGLQPAMNNASKIASQITEILRLLNMNILLTLVTFPRQAGYWCPG